MLEGRKLISLPLNWSWVEERSGQDKGLLLRYCWIQSQKDLSIFMGLYLQEVCPFPSMSHPFRGKWSVIHSRIHVIAKKILFSREEERFGGIISIMQISTDRDQLHFCFIDQLIQTALSSEASVQVWPLIGQDLVGTGNGVGRMCIVRPPSYLQNINSDHKGMPLLFCFCGVLFANKFN